jgi:hypothetical protein
MNDESLSYVALILLSTQSEQSDNCGNHGKIPDYRKSD